MGKCMGWVNVILVSLVKVFLIKIKEISSAKFFFVKRVMYWIYVDRFKIIMIINRRLVYKLIYRWNFK